MLYRASHPQMQGRISQIQFLAQESELNDSQKQSQDTAVTPSYQHTFSSSEQQAAMTAHIKVCSGIDFLLDTIRVHELPS